MDVCRASGGDVEQLLIDSNKKSRSRDARDYHLTRHPCYIIAESADGRKHQVALATIDFIDLDAACKSTANATHHEAGDSVRTLLIAKNIYPEQLPTPTKSYQQLLHEEEARQRILSEDRTGLWARLLAGRDDPIDDGQDDRDAE